MALRIDPVLALATRPWRAVVAAGVLLASGAIGFYWFSDGPQIQTFSNDAHVIGTLALLTLLPVYLIGAFFYLLKATEVYAEEQKQAVPPAAHTRLLYSMQHLHWSGWLMIIGLVAFGIYQNQYVIFHISDGRAFNALDIGVLLGNALLWGTIGVFFAWRIPVVMALANFGRNLLIDVYELRPARRLANLAVKDVLIVAGAMAFMPLQALDAQFRWGNYQAGLTLGIPTATLLVLVPLLGTRASIRRAKLARLQDIEAAIAATDRAQLEQLESLSAHRDRVRALPEWPFDSGMVLKLLGYSVIAPLAWVGAALVENLVDNFTG